MNANPLTPPGATEVWRHNTTALDHYVIHVGEDADTGEVSVVTWSLPIITFCQNRAGDTWFGPLEEFRKQFQFVRMIPRKQIK